MWFILLTIITIVIIIILLYWRPAVAGVNMKGFSIKRIPWKILALAAVGAYAFYLTWYYLHGREEVLVTHYLVQGIQGECIEDNAVGDITSFALRRWESERFTVPNGHRRCYYPLNRLEFKTQDRGRVHIVSLR
tara:strand:+ start:15104 stop:15505 length:402 start_codon:yes stop_codon:yes gene_type:complete